MRKAEQSARTKSALVEAAIMLFGERGYRASSLKAIAKQAGITHGVIPFHFGSKEGLLLEVVDVCFKRYAALTFAPMMARDRDYGLGDLDALLTSQLQFADRHPEIARVFHILMAEALGPSPELRPHFRAFHERVHGIGCEWVREGQRRGALRAELDVHATVDTLLAYLTGTRTLNLLAGLDRAVAHRQMLKILEGGVIAAPSGDEGTDAHDDPA